MTTQPPRKRERRGNENTDPISSLKNNGKSAVKIRDIGLEGGLTEVHIPRYGLRGRGANTQMKCADIA